MKKALWFTLGMLSLCMAYIGVFVPGIPWSTFVVLSAYCFAKSSDKMHNWLYNHKTFGPFLIGWQEKRIFPTKLKYFMLATMSSSLVIMWFTTGNVLAVFWTGVFMILVAIWAWRYPGSEKEFERRKKEGKKVAWLK